MSNVEHFDIKTLERFLEFLCENDRAMSRSEVQSTLQSLGIDSSRATSKVHLLLNSLSVKTASSTAEVPQLRQNEGRWDDIIPFVGNLKACLQKLMAERAIGDLQQAAYFDRLEDARSEEDFRSLWIEIQRMDIPPDKADGQ